MKKKKNDLQISLFPFLSILACVIGILTLMITAIVIAQIDPEAVDMKEDMALEEDEEFQKKIAEQEQELDKLRQEIRSVEENSKKSIDPKRKEQLRKEIAAVVKETEKRKSETKQRQTIQGQLVKVKDGLAKLMKDLEEAEEEWELMKDPEKFATMVVKQSGSGAGGDLEPTFIECHAKGVRVYEENGKHYEVPTSQISGHAKLRTLIQKVAREAPYRTWISAQGSKIEARFVKRDGSNIVLKDKKGKDIKLTAIQLAPGSRNVIVKYAAAKAINPNLSFPEARYVIFLIRNKGFSSLTKAAQVCAKFNCRYGKLPLDGEGELDLSIFSGS